MKQLIFFLILSSILFGCNKPSDEDYTLTGVVLDFDTYTTIAGAKVYVKEQIYLGTVVDSAVSDANGRVSFTYRKDGAFKFLYPAKANYLNPISWGGAPFNYNDRTDNLYLARPSFVNVTVHKNAVYLPLDTIAIQIKGDYIHPFGGIYNRLLHRDKADAPDKIFNLQAVYGHLMGDIFFGASKLYFIKDIIRNGAVISTQTDSTGFIQFGTQNFTLNY